MFLLNCSLFSLSPPTAFNRIHGPSFLPWSARPIYGCGAVFASAHKRLLFTVFPSYIFSHTVCIYMCMHMCVYVYCSYVCTFPGLAASLSWVYIRTLASSVLFDIYANGLGGQHSLPCSDTGNWASLPHYGCTYSCSQTKLRG